jgi:hypothetical protein
MHCRQSGPTGVDTEARRHSDSNGPLLTRAPIFFCEALIVLVVVPLDQFAVHHLFATAGTGDILAEIRVRAAEITKKWQRLFNLLFLSFSRHSVIRSDCDAKSLAHYDEYFDLETRYSIYRDFICWLAITCLTGGSLRTTPRIAAIAR